MYRAKGEGRARSAVFAETMRAAAVGRLDTEIALRQAIVNGDLRVVYQQIVALADAFASSPLCARLAGARAVRHEEPFAFAHDGELIRGVIDACGIEADGRLLIVDYKTDALSQGEDLAAHIERDYGLQRLIYALAGLCSGAERVEVAYCFLRAPLEPVTSTYLAARREPLEAALRERLEPLRAGRFEVTPLPGRQRCATCPGRLRLCSYDESLTLRELPAATSAAPLQSNR